MPGRGPPAVRLVSPHALALDRRRATEKTKHISRWIVQGIVMATTSFALLDLYLLLSHH